MSTASISSFGANSLCPLSAPANLTPHIPSKDLIDHISAYIGSAKGAWDVFRILEYSVSCLQFLPNMGGVHKKLIDKISSVMHTSGVALSIPFTVTELVSLRNNYRYLNNAYTIAPSDPDRIKIISHAYRRCFVGCMDLTNTICQASLFLHDTTLTNLGKKFSWVDAIYNVTSIASDIIELVEAIFKWLDCRLELTQEREQNAIINLKQKQNLAWLHIAKNIPSIIEAVIALAAIFFTQCQTPLFAMVTLGLNVTWLSLKVISNIYERVTLYTK